MAFQWFRHHPGHWHGPQGSQHAISFLCAARSLRLLKTRASLQCPPAPVDCACGPGGLWGGLPPGLFRCPLSRDAQGRVSAGFLLLSHSSPDLLSVGPSFVNVRHNLITTQCLLKNKNPKLPRLKVTCKKTIQKKIKNKNKRVEGKM